MPGKSSAKKAARKSATKAPATKGTATRKTSTGFTAEERAAAKAYAKERKAEARGENDERAVLAAIAEMPERDRGMAQRLHALIKTSAPDLAPRTWYGMPAYAKDGKVVCFFRGGHKFKERYAMLGFNDSANLDDGDMWPVAFAVNKLTAADEKRIGALVKKAVR
jgi:hypothetical protein